MARLDYSKASRPLPRSSAPAPGSVVFAARFAGECYQCAKSIKRRELITRCRGFYVHAKCEQAAHREFAGLS